MSEKLGNKVISFQPIQTEKLEQIHLPMNRLEMQMSNCTVTWLCDVSVNFVNAILKTHGSVDVKVINGFLTRPPKRVNSGVENQTEGTNEVVRVIADQLNTKKLNVTVKNF